MGRGGATRRSLLLLAGLGSFGALTIGAAPATAQGSNVLLVCQSPGTGTCPSSAYSTIQAAVDVYNPATDWGVLIWPGDYHESGAPSAGVLVDQTKTGIHIRGMDRNGTIVDGTLPTASQPCSSAASDQNEATARNGIDVEKADDTWIENLTVCNFLGNGTDVEGNQIWWDGGIDAGQIGLGAYWGNYITGTTTYYNPSDSHQGYYGIFSSHAGDPEDPSWIANAYASNMADSAFYIGACQQQCNVTLDHVVGEDSAIGYSGTNAGGKLIIQNSEWDQNRSGIVPNSLNNTDAPPPQDGACDGSNLPGPQLSGTPCTEIRHNLVHDNNNPNAPGAGIAGSAPVGTGIEISGGEFDAVHDNTVYNQKAWGIAVHDFPDTEQPPSVSTCQGAVGPGGSAPLCYFIAHGNQIYDNTLYNNGGFSNPTNGDLASQPAAPAPRNCFYGNTDSQGPLTSDPPAIQTVDGQPCSAPGVGDSGPLTAELVCASGIFGACPDTSGVPGSPPVNNYPQPTGPALIPFSVADSQPTMPNPCRGVPDNAWCLGGNPTTSIP